MFFLILQDVNVRKEPRIVDFKLGKVYITNKEGQLKKGDVRKVLDVITDKSGMTWGQISNPDPNGKALWFCISTVNTEFAREHKPEGMPESVPSDWQESVEARLTRLEKLHEIG